MRKINLLAILIMIVVEIILYSQLPNSIPMHWNIKGQIDNYMPKQWAIWILPALTILIYIFFQIIPSLDPRREKYKLFKKEWEIIQSLIIGFIIYLQFIILYASLRNNLNIMPLMFVGLGILFFILGINLPKIKQNFFIGVRTPWALTDEKNWDKTQWFAGRCFIALGIVILLEAILSWSVPLVVFGSIILVAVLPIIYSFLLFKKKI